MPRDDIKWETFVESFPKERIRSRFEDLCRQLFWHVYLSGNRNNRYPLYSVNQPGIETEPVFSESEGIYVGFQAKYTESKNMMSEFRESAKKSLSYKGRLDRIILFSRYPIDSKMKSLIDGVLAGSGIETECVSGDVLLDMVRNAPINIQNYYFSDYPLTHELFVSNIENAIGSLSASDDFRHNVKTGAEEVLSVFTESRRGAAELNRKKDNAYRKALGMLSLYNGKEHIPYLLRLRQALGGIKNVVEPDLAPALEWVNIIDNALQGGTSGVEKTDGKSSDDERKRVFFEDAREIIESVRFSGEIRECLEKRILVLHGNGGMGKTHTLLNEARVLIDEGRDCLFIPGRTLKDCKLTINSRDIPKEILGLDISLGQLIDFLEIYGGDNGREVIVFIDAVNEVLDGSRIRDFLALLFRKIEECSHVKVAVSCRSEFVDSYLPCAYSARCAFVDMNETDLGFDGDAVLEMLRSYRIAFSPDFLGNTVLNNPLFLKQYCLMAGDGGQSRIDIHELFDSVKRKLNERSWPYLKDTLSGAGYSDIDDWVSSFIDAFIEKEIDAEEKSLSLKTVKSIPILNNDSLRSEPFVRRLKELGVLTESRGRISFTFEMMNDYFLAVHVVQNNDRNAVRHYMASHFKTDCRSAFYNSDLFAQIAVLYALKFGEECCDFVPKGNKAFIRAYIQSFAWRTDNKVSAEKLIEIAENVGCTDKLDVWSCFLARAMDEESLLNAGHLSDILSSLKIAERDYRWTQYINRYEDNASAANMMKMLIEHTDVFIGLSEVKKELLLIMCSWLLSSTNRPLRDKLSKAMVVLLSDNPGLCEKLLKRFKNVDDPFILERLFEIVFGVVTRSSSLNAREFDSLFRFVYNFVFCGAETYPDIVIRDSACLMLRYYLYISPDNKLGIDCERIEPPYNCTPFVFDETKTYRTIGELSGTEMILMAMNDNPMNGMGDGEYWMQRFQNAIPELLIKNPDIMQEHLENSGKVRYWNNRVGECVKELSEENLKKYHDYALYLIFEKYGYTDEYFNELDVDTIEAFSANLLLYSFTFGEKYQQISCNEVLARAYDELGYDYYVDLPKKDGSFTFRNLDSTLNFSSSEKANEDSEIAALCCESYTALSSDFMSRYTNKERDVLSLLKTQLEKQKFVDYEGNKWVNLFSSSNYGVLSPEFLFYSGDGCSFNISFQGVFVPEDRLKLLDEVREGKYETTLIDFPAGRPYLYSREYPWSETFRSLVESANNEIKITSPDGKEQYLDGSFFSVFTLNNLFKDDFSDDEHAHMHYVPCLELIEHFGLMRGASSDYTWNKNGETVAGYYRVTGKTDGLVIRKNLLDDFLDEKRMSLVWIITVDGFTNESDFYYSGFVNYSESPDSMYISKVNSLFDLEEE